MKRTLYNNFLLAGIFSLISLGSYAQNRITGNVTDSQTHTPVVGASVIADGSQVGTTTDPKGNFVLIAPAEAQRFTVSYLGYESQTREIGAVTNFDIVLSPSVSVLDQIVVIGYGGMKRGDITGAVTSVDISETQAAQVASFDRLLQGRAAGVDVVTGSSAPGGAVSITIRGAGSINTNTEPLYVVDGVIINSTNADVGSAFSGVSNNENQNSLSMINPRDIESMEVLKDASATAIYGSQGANGVILITTKQGKSSKPTINVSSTLDLGWRNKTIDVLDLDGYLAYRNDMGTPVANLPADASPVNWQDYAERMSTSHSTRVSVSGKSDNTKYYIAGGMQDNQGVVLKTGVKQYDLRINLTSNLGKYVTLGTNSTISNRINHMTQGTDVNTGSAGAAFNSMIRQMINSRPYIQPDIMSIDEDEDAAIGVDRWLKDYEDKSVEYRVVPSLFLEVQIKPWLKFRSSVGADYRNKERDKYEGPLLQRRASDYMSRTGTAEMVSYSYNFDNQLTFDKQLGKSNLSVMLGTSASSTYQKDNQYEAWNMFDGTFRQDGFNYAGQTFPNAYSESGFSLLSFFGRATYSYDNRYILTTTFRADGSSKFAPGKKFGYFPSFAFAWRINEEGFMKNVKHLDNLKLRVGWGQVGNQSLAPYQTLNIFDQMQIATWDPILGIPGFTYGFTPYSVGNTITNPNLRWETSEQYNVGLDLGMFDNRFSLTVDAYNKVTKDLLLKAAIPPSSANGSGKATYMWVNRGEIRNRGLEISVNAIPIQKKDFSWNLSANISFNRNQILSLGSEQLGDYGIYKGVEAFYGENVTNGGSYFSGPANIFMAGYPMGMFFGYRMNGLVTDPDDPYLELSYRQAPIYNLDAQGNPIMGMRRYVDTNGDGDINDNDRVIIGDPNPKFTGGFATGFTYKGWSLDLAFTGVYGNQIANGNSIVNWSTGYMARTHGNNIASDAYYKAWNPVTNPNGTAPALLSMTQTSTNDFQDWIIEDGSYLRLSNVTLTYRFNFRETSAIRNLDLSVTGRNLWLLTNYSGFDPDVNSFAGDANGLRRGIDYGSYPGSKGVIFGLNLTF